MAPHSYRDVLLFVDKIRLQRQRSPGLANGPFSDEALDVIADALSKVSQLPGPNGKTWTDGDFLDQALTNATGSILSQYAADVIRKRAIELRLSATGTPQEKKT